MIYYGASTNPASGIMKDLAILKKWRLDFAEISMEEPLGMPALLLKQRKQIINFTNKNSMFLLGHAPYWAETGTTYNTIREVWLKEIKKTIGVAAALSAKSFIVHPTYHGLAVSVPEIKKIMMKNYIHSFKELVKCSKEHNITVLIENLPSNDISIKDLKFIVRRVPGLKVVIDIGHANVAGGKKMIGKCLETFRKDLVHLHMSDNGGDNDEHYPIGAGSIDYEYVVRKLKKMGFHKGENTITFEIHQGKEHTPNSMRIIKLMMES